MTLEYPYFMADLKKAHDEELFAQKERHLAVMAQKKQEYLASKIQMIKNVMSATHQNVQDVLMMAQIPKEEWPQYLEQLEKDRDLSA